MSPVHKNALSIHAMGVNLPDGGGSEMRVKSAIMPLIEMINLLSPAEHKRVVK